jgi:hypothetical protein
VQQVRLVETYADRHGTTYPDMTWEPKEVFRAIAAVLAVTGSDT